MAQTLTKPVFLDETGQDIADKLDDIKQAIIDSAGEFIPLLIRVTTPPTKTSYLAGEELDLTGIVVSLVGSNGAMIDVTAGCTFSPANGTTLTSEVASVQISYTYPVGSLSFTTSQSIVVRELASIAITTPPTQTEYMVDETLDLTGIVVTATYENGSTAVVTSECTFSPDDGDTLTLSDTAITVSYTEGAVTKTATQSITVSAPIYGAEWDGTSTSAWTRTDLAENFTNPIPFYTGIVETPSSPFDNIMPWSGMQIVEDDTVGTLVSIPKFWYKLTQNGAGIKIQISNRETQGFHVSPAHMDRGDDEGERDVIYVSKYCCASTSYKSSANTTVQTGVAIGTMRSNIHSKLGEDIWMFDFNTLFTIWLLYLVEYADWNSQAKIGYGKQKSSSITMGDTKDMPYHTGTVATSRSAVTAGVQYRYIEGLWDVTQQWLRGATNSNNGFVIQINPSLDSGGVAIGSIPQNTDAYTPTAFEVKDIQGAFPVFIPTAIGSNENVYSCDAWNYVYNRTALFTGTGGYDRYGLFGMDCTTTNSSSISYFSARFIKLPSNS